MISMGEQSIHIGLISPLPPPLGGISHWTTLVHLWVASKHSVNITQIDISPRWRAIDNKNPWTRVIGGSLQAVRDLFRFNKKLLSHHFDTIHLTTSGKFAVFRDIIFFLNVSVWKIPIVYHIRFGRVPEIARNNSWEWQLISWVMKRVDMVIAIDAETTETIREYCPEATVSLLPNCINFSELPQQIPSHRFFRKAVFVGWVIPTKGISELVEAWANIQPQGWVLEIAGPGDRVYQQELIARFSPENIQFLGELPHRKAIDLIAGCDLFVLPSYTEGFPNVILEAMALKKAIVATNVGAIPEMLKGECGLLVEPKNATELAQAIHSFAINDALRVEMGQRAYDRAKANYSEDVVFGKLLEVWQQVRR
jgi:glycosyltransferase involved in cell wall biosynthesis